MTPLTCEERGRKIFEASIGCTAAAVEFLRSVNKPLNVTFIANTAWEIAKKLEEMMEQSIKQNEVAEAGGTVASNKPVSSVDLMPVHSTRKPAPPTDTPLEPQDELDLEPLPSGSFNTGR